MSNSELVCARDGPPVHGVRDSCRHLMGGRTGPILAHRRHKPVPVLRADYNRAFAADTPLDEARALLARFRALDAEVNGPRGGTAKGEGKGGVSEGTG